MKSSFVKDYFGKMELPKRPIMRFDYMRLRSYIVDGEGLQGGHFLVFEAAFGRF
jgi:hypothetical protein